MELKVKFELKLILIQWLNEEDWIKSMYIENITYCFFKAIMLHVCDSQNIIKQKELKKIVTFKYKSFPFSYDNVFFPKMKIL